MTEKRFSKREAIEFGWQTTRANIGFFIIFLVVSMLISTFFSGFADLFEKRLPFLSIIFNLGYVFLTVAINLVGIKIALKFCDNDQRPLIDVISFTPRLFLKFAAGYILFSLLVAAGLLLLIAPGVYFMIRYQYVLYFIADRDADIWEAFKKSSTITGGIKWELLVFLILLCLINVAGFMCFVVGLLVSIPVTMLAAASVYRKLSGTVKEEAVNPFQAPRQAQ
ncbi:MAG TPA: hypothetical protein VHC46_08780 [Thermodesulfobacteriota bacterium]|nr:hypothetical protein [Thermodesulfobacteriota bacterium]